MSEDFFNGTWIRMVKTEKPPNRKTDIYGVLINDTSLLPLGKIKWYPPWRKFAFFPISDTIYENVCLKEIAGFIEKLMVERKAKFIDTSRLEAEK